MKKPVECRKCGSKWHYQSGCPLNRKPISRYGKKAQNWTDRRKQWITEHPTSSGTWNCYLCGVALNIHELTIDHLIPRSNAKNYANRDDDRNLRPCCIMCNSIKGSKHYDL